MKAGLPERETFCLFLYLLRQGHLHGIYRKEVGSRSRGGVLLACTSNIDPTYNTGFIFIVRYSSDSSLKCLVLVRGEPRRGDQICSCIPQYPRFLPFYLFYCSFCCLP